jgi:hypothetical protein
VSFILAAIMGIAGVSVFLYGGLNLYKVSQTVASQDGVASLLSDFIKCSDLSGAINSMPNNSTVDYAQVSHVVQKQCQAKQAPAKLSIGLAGAFIILALLSAPCAFKRDNWVVFGIMMSTAIACTLIASVVVGSQALEPASHLMDCKHLSQPTIDELTSKYGMVCFRAHSVTGELITKKSAQKWICKLVMFFGGAAASIFSLLFLLVIRSCKCCRRSSTDASVAPSRSCCGISCCSSAVHAPLSAQADVDDLPVTAPSFYDVNAPEPAVASEDAGASPSYRAYTVN